MVEGGECAVLHKWSLWTREAKSCLPALFAMLHFFQHFSPWCPMPVQEKKITFKHLSKLWDGEGFSSPEVYVPVLFKINSPSSVICEKKGIFGEGGLERDICI